MPMDQSALVAAGHQVEIRRLDPRRHHPFVTGQAREPEGQGLLVLGEDVTETFTLVSAGGVEIGFVDLMPGGGHGFAGCSNVSWIEVYATPRER